MADDNVDANDNTDANDTLLKPDDDQKTDDQKTDDQKTDDQKTDDQKADDQKTDDQGKDDKTDDKTDGKKDDKTDDKEDGAPTKYDDFKLPEGAVVDDALMGEFSILAKELNLPQESAQKVIDLVPKLTEAMETKRVEEWQGVRDAWVKDIKEDAELGGNNFAETLERANRVLRNYAPEGLRTFLAETGYGDNADLVRMLSKVDKALGEDKIVDGVPAGEKDKTAAQLLYPDQGK